MLKVGTERGRRGSEKLSLRLYLVPLVVALLKKTTSGTKPKTYLLLPPYAYMTLHKSIDKQAAA
jgi:hypothetical protein